MKANDSQRLLNPKNSYIKDYPYTNEEADNSDNYFLNNSDICNKYGQTNIENGLYCLIIISVLSGLIMYLYQNQLKSKMTYLIISSLIFDILLIFFYIYMRTRFHSNETNDIIPKKAIGINDISLILNFIFKVFLLVLAMIKYISLGFIILFIVKFLLEFYFFMTCAKLLIFCPLFSTLEGFVLKISNRLSEFLDGNKTAFQTDENRYNVFEEIDSFYV